MRSVGSFCAGAAVVGALWLALSPSQAERMYQGWMDAQTLKPLRDGEALQCSNGSIMRVYRGPEEPDGTYHLSMEWADPSTDKLQAMGLCPK